MSSPAPSPATQNVIKTMACFLDVRIKEIICFMSSGKLFRGEKSYSRELSLLMVESFGPVAVGRM